MNFHHFLIHLLPFILFNWAIVAIFASEVKKSTAHINSDILNEYGDYQVQMNGFNVDACGKITYPALFDSLQYAENKHLKPCDDFYEFVCRGVKNTIDKAKEKKKAEGKIQTRIGNSDTEAQNELIAEQIQIFWLDHLSKPNLRKEFPQNGSTQKMFKFFDKCMKHGSEIEELPKMLASQFGLNYILNNDSTVPIEVFNQDWIERTHPFNPFFAIEKYAAKEHKKVRQQQSNGNSSKLFFIQLSNFLDRNGTLDFLNWFQEENATSILEALRKMGGDGGGERQQKMVRQKLLEIADVFGAIGSNISLDEKPLFGQMTIDEVQAKFSLNGTLNWLKMLQNVYPNEKVDGKDQARFFFYNSTQKMFSTLQRYTKIKDKIEKAAFSQYLLLALVRVVLSHNIEEFPPYRCMRQYVFQFFPHQLSQQLFQKTATEDSYRPGGPFDLSNLTRVGMKKMLENGKMLGDRAQFFEEKIDRFLITIGIDPEVQMSQDVVNSIYESYQLNDSMNWLEMLVQVKRKFERLLPLRKLWFTYNDRVGYFADFRQITVGVANKLLPLFHAKFPDAYNFGAFAQLVGRQLTNTLQMFPPNMGYDALEGKSGQRAWDKTYTDAYAKMQQCLVDQYKREFEKFYVNKNFTTPDSFDEDIADNVGMQAAYHGWKQFLTKQKQNGGPQFAAPLAKYSQEQIFFISYAFPYCFTDSGDPERNATPDPNLSAPRFRVNLPLANFEPFSRAFQCKPEDVMNKKGQCTFF